MQPQSKERLFTQPRASNECPFPEWHDTMAFVSFMVKSVIHLGNDAPICIQYRNVSYQMQNTYFNYPFLTHNKENQEFLCSANQILREINISVFRKFKNCHVVQFQRN